MKLIAHRGLLKGPDKTLENHPDQILKVVELGYDCEVDFWLVDSKFYLGHDTYQYQIDEYFLSRLGKLWIHAKNLDALHWLSSSQQSLNYFWHQEDDFTLTSQGYIWTYPGKLLTNLSISVMPEWNDPNFNNLNFNCFGICSDYILKIEQLQR